MTNIMTNYNEDIGRRITDNKELRAMLLKLENLRGKIEHLEEKVAVLEQTIMEIDND